MTKNDIDIRDIVHVNIKHPDSWFTGSSTYTTFFVMPAYDLLLDINWYKHFVDSYIGDHELKHNFKRPLFILIQYQKITKEFAELNNYLRLKRSFVYSYLVGKNRDTFFRMYVFECPLKYKSDYDCFLNSQYSKFSIDYKSKFPETIQNEKGEYIESPFYGAINKTPSFKKKVEKLIDEKLDNESELFSEIKKEFEIFRYPIQASRESESAVSI